MKADLPKNINVLVERIVALLNPSQVILYGSRSRGTHHHLSDFDIAVVCHNNPKGWSDLHWELEEGVLTLYPVDIVDYNDASDLLKEQISKDGEILYDRN